MLVIHQHTKDMRIEQGNKTISDLGYDKYLTRPALNKGSKVMVRGDNAAGDLKGLYPRPTIIWDNGNDTYDDRYVEVAGDTMTGNLVMPVFSQDGEPDTDDIAAGECAFWIDTNDSNKLYLCYNQAGTVKTVEMT